MLKGRLGLDKAKMPYADRHGLLWLDRGRLWVKDGCLRFETTGGALEAGDYQIPHQTVSMILLGPGGSVTHDAMRIMANHGTAFVVVGQDGVRQYTGQPIRSGDSALARRQATLWARSRTRLDIARRMYTLRMGYEPPRGDIEILRGLEGSRVKKAYRDAAERHGIEWSGRRYDRANPGADDIPNQAINHAASAVTAAAAIAVSATGTISPLGFVHEDSGDAFILDIADLFRDTVTLEIAFSAAKKHETLDKTLDHLVRSQAVYMFERDQVIPAMIDAVKSVLR